MSKATKILLAAVIMVSFFFTQAASHAVDIVKGGNSRWRVHCPKESGPVEHFAASELVKYIEQISGFRMKEARRTGKWSISVGLREHFKLGELPEQKNGFDGYRLLISPDRIVIAGDTPRGALYGVYDLLERLGCRWHQMSLDPKDPEVVPWKPDLSLPAGKWSEAGKIELRIFNGSAFFFDLHPERMLPQIDWAAKNRYNGVSWQAHHKPESVRLEIEQMERAGVLAELDKRGLMLHGPGHSFPFFLPTETYFEKHPEWFGFLDGKRRPHGGEFPAVNYCWSNAEANEEFIRNVEAFLRKYTQLKIFLPVWIDGGRSCQCEACVRRGAANLIVELFNQLSERMEKSAPGVKLEAVVGYPPLEKPPEGVVANGKWQALYAHWGRNHKQSYNDPEYVMKENLRTWSSFFKDFSLCSYYATTSHQPINGPPFLHALANDTKYLVANKIKESLVMQYPHGFWWNFAFNLSSAGTHAYYFPERQPAEELKDYSLTYFGPAAGPVVANYFRQLSDNLEISYRASRGSATDEDMATLQKMKALIDDATQKAAQDRIVLYRLQKLAAGHELLIRWGDGLKYLRAAEAKMKAMETDATAKDEVRKAIQAGRDYAASFLSHAATVEKDFPGITSAEWMESWYLNRTLLGPLKKLEQKLSEY